jgi:uncharacterized membrane protein YoaK (UPF0700 family)
METGGDIASISVLRGAAMFSRHNVSLLLTTVAGSVDAIGYARLGGFYPSIMTGNTTQLGLAVSGHEWNLVGIAATVLGLFFVGSFCGGLTAALQAGWRLPVVLGSEAVLLATAVGLALIFKREQAAGLLLPVAMGVQNAAIEELRRSAGGATFVTGTLFRAGHEFAKALMGGAHVAWLPQPLAWTSFAVGVGVGALGKLRRLGAERALHDRSPDQRCGTRPVVAAPSRSPRRSRS